MGGEGEEGHGSRRRPSSSSRRHALADDDDGDGRYADAYQFKENGHRHRDRDRDREGSAHDSYRQKERFRDDADRDRRRDERGRDKNSHHHDDDQVAERRNHNRQYEHERERRHRHHRSRSPERAQEHDSHSRSRSRDRKSKRASGFDMGPSGAVAVTNAVFSGAMLNPQSGSLLSTAAGLGSALPALGQIPGMGSVLPGVFPSMFPFAGGTQATRHARRVYVGGLPIMANEQNVAAFFSQVMAAIGGNTAGPGDAVVNVYINQEKRFAFVEMRTVEEASNAMALDGIVYEGVAVRVRRPTDYNPSLAATLGPSQPSPHLNLAAIGLIPGAAGCADGAERIFVGGLPYYLTEEQIIDLLSSFGPLRAFDLVKDRDTGTSKGYAFCIYQDSAVMDIACAALNGLKMGDRTLTVRRASASGQPKPDQTNILVQAQQQIAIQKLLLASGGNPTNEGNLAYPGSGMMLSGASFPSKEVPTRIVRLSNVVSEDELRDDTTYEEISEDMREECAKYGNLINLIIPRPSLNQEVPGLGMVFVEYADPEGAEKAKASLNGRKFGSNTVTASYYSEERFVNGDYGG